ncbi:MAG: hypothetical protein D6694_05395 [Gammaproteobacteria bacterium]|nr:MAG: hypothetical protein D6694_05395 [Gammaproteobacteria bacterium]
MMLFDRIRRLRGLANALAVLGYGIYAWRVWQYAHAVDTVLDEGLYLLKGYMFANGTYRPFQEYGPWTNHMPFSFLIPGWVQVVFGPGLRSGRYFALFLALLFAVGVWVIARRLSSDWGAALAVITLAMNTAMIRTYSTANSQGLVACMLIWILALTLGENRRSWQVIIGVALAGVLALTRLNMTPLLFLLLVYVWWQHDVRVAGWATIVGLSIVIAVYIHYYPGIMSMWVGWFPQRLTPFLDIWRHKGVNSWQSAPIPAKTRLISLFQGFYLHFVPLVGAAAVWILWPVDWKAAQRRMALFLSVTFGVFLLAHAWASLGKDYCVYCFSTYLFFFDVTALLLVLLAFGHWRTELTPIRQAAAIGVVLIGVTTLLAGYTYHFGSGTPTVLDKVIKLPVPRFSGGIMREGTVPLDELLLNKSGLLQRYPYDQAMAVLDNWLRGAIVALLLVVILTLLFRLPKILHQHGVAWLPAHPFSGALVLFLLAGWLLSPIGILGRSSDSCSGNVDIIASYEAAGAYLRSSIPSDSLVYWQGSDSQVLLLYLDRARFFPQQLNIESTLRVGDADTLARYGFWNDTLARRWRQEADVILVEERVYDDEIGEYVTSGEFDELLPAPATGCRPGTALHIYLRKKKLNIKE